MSNSGDVSNLSGGQNWTPYIYIAIACVIFIIVLIGSVKWKKQKKKSKFLVAGERSDRENFSMKVIFDELAALQKKILERFKQKQD